MKVAAIVITYNDDYKIEEWVEHHQSYKNELFYHIIVDNGSKPQYLEMVKNSFPDSHIIKRSTNGGCTGAYNDGIRFALSDIEVDAIMLIGNDMKLETESINKLYDFLNSNAQYGMVAPILLGKDCDIVDDFGCEVSKTLYMQPSGVGKHISEINEDKRVVTAVTGGMNMAKREFYEKVGLQDENLFMYSDEVDMAIRAKKAGYKMAVTKSAKAWHQHVNPKNANSRNGYTTFLINRNKIYLGYKHFSFKRVFQIFLKQLLNLPIVTISYIKNNKTKHLTFYLLGSFFGIFRIHKNFNWIINN